MRKKILKTVTNERIIPSKRALTSENGAAEVNVLAEERRDIILQMIRDGLPVRVGELSVRFEVSESTIRRDLQDMGSCGLIKRTYGGAVSKRTGAEPSFNEKEIINIEAKKQLAKAAAELVEAGDFVLLDAGTTMVQIAMELRGKEITVVTNSMDVAMVFYESPEVEVILLGGRLRKTPRSLVGPLADNALSKVRLDKAFLAANGVDVLFGASTHDLAEAETKKNMQQAARLSYLVIDSSKLGKEYFARIAPLAAFSGVIIDREIDGRYLEELRELTEVILA
jgi:DeoR family fructose operon transcriptional repressor